MLGKIRKIILKFLGFSSYIKLSYEELKSYLCLDFYTKKQIDEKVNFESISDEDIKGLFKETKSK